MTDERDRGPRFDGPPGGTATRLCKRPDLARGRLKIDELRASSSASRASGDDWTYKVSAKVEVGAESMVLDLPGRVALDFGLSLVEGAVFCHMPGQAVGGERRPSAPLPTGEELRLLGLAARAAAQRSPETEADLTYLRGLVGRTQPGEAAPAGRHEHELDALRRAGLITVAGYGSHTSAVATPAGRTLATMLGGAA